MGVVGLVCGSLVYSDRQLGHNGYLLVMAKHSAHIMGSKSREQLRSSGILEYFKVPRYVPLYTF